MFKAGSMGFIGTNKNLKRTILLIFCGITILYAQKYDLKNPSVSFSLPADLKEISDITIISSSTIACIQDEKGILYQYNIKKNLVTRRDSFYMNGDYEGIAKVNNDIYVLRADGVLLEISNALKDNRTIQTHVTNIPAIDNEGLCFDETNNRLLIASKSKSGNSKDAKGKRLIYAFDLGKKEMIKEPVMEIQIAEIKKYLSDKYGMTDATMNKFKFKPSAIAIHPLNGSLYLLSAASYLLCVFNNGILESVETLNPLLFNKAEGICFLNNGDMLVSNEGQTGNASLLLFKYK